jgi:hypothetical protein
MPMAWRGSGSSCYWRLMENEKQLRRLMEKCRGTKSRQSGEYREDGCVSQLLFTLTNAWANQLIKGKVSFAHTFEGFSPWLVGSVALGKATHRGSGGSVWVGLWHSTTAHSWEVEKWEKEWGRDQNSITLFKGLPLRTRKFPARFHLLNVLPPPCSTMEWGPKLSYTISGRHSRSQV